MLPLCLSAVSWERAGVLVFWAFLEAKREVRADGAVGVPFFMSRALLRMLEMSSLTDGRRAGESGCAGALLTAGGSLLSSCCLRMDVANDREDEAFKGWALQCLETKATLLAGSLCARNGMTDCEERIMVSRAFMRSIARKWQRPDKLCVRAARVQCNGGGVGNTKYALDWLHSGEICGVLIHMTRVSHLGLFD